ncbi:MAG: PTS glucose transporter subunit IIA [Bacillota bacterium]|nr:PTS glucose transporter subunit IIA [Bacillota bacterium]
MGFFDKFKKKEALPSFSDENIVAICSGKMIPPSEISDPLFQQEMMGQTIGFVPSKGTFVCPVNGTVTMTFPTGHAFGILGNDGNGYLVHIGIDTVSMNGKGFKTLIKQGQSVKAGQVAVEVDLKAIEKAGLSTTTMLIVTDKKEADFKVNYIPFGAVEKCQIINQ